MTRAGLVGTTVLAVACVCGPCFCAGTSWPSAQGPFDGTHSLDPAPVSGGRTEGVSLVLWRRLAVEADRLYTGDLDGDGRLELVAHRLVDATADSGARQELTAVGGDLRPIWRLSRGSRGGCVLADLDGDGDCEIVLSGMGQPEAAAVALEAGRAPPAAEPVIETIDGDGRVRWRRWLSPETEDRGAAQVGLHVFLAEDVDGDGRVELCLHWNSFREEAREARGRRFCLLIREGQESPHAVAEMPMIPRTVATEDLTGDGSREIVVAGHAINNGMTDATGALSDREARVVAFDARLRRLWVSPVLGGYYTWAEACVTGTRDRDRRVYAWTAGSREIRTERGAVVVLDPQTGAVSGRADLPAGVQAGCAGSFTGRGVGFAALGGGLGVRLFDGSLRPMPGPSAVPSGAVMQAVGADLDGDGHLELVGTRTNPDRIHLVDVSGFRADRLLEMRRPYLAASYNVKAIAPWDCDGDGRPEIAVACAGGVVDIYRAVPAGPREPTGLRRFPLPTEAADFEWSPDGRYLATLAQPSAEYGPPSPAGRTLSIHRWDGRAATTLSETRGVHTLAFGLDGTRMALITGARREPCPLRALVRPWGTDAKPRFAPPEAVTLPAEGEVLRGAELLVARLPELRWSKVASGDFGPGLCWSEEGQVLCTSVSSRGGDVVRVDTESGRIAPVPGASDPRWDESSPVLCGAHLLFSRAEAVPLPYPTGDRDYTVVPSVCSVQARAVPRCIHEDAALHRGLLSLRVAASIDYGARLGEPVHHVYGAMSGLAASPTGDTVAGRLTVTGDHADHGQRKTWQYTMDDVWLVNLQTGELQALSTDDTRTETDLRFSADGLWTAYAESGAETGAGLGSTITAAAMGGEAAVSVGRGSCPRWSPTNPRELWFLREGRLCAVSLPTPAPPRGPLAAGELLSVGAALATVLLAMGTWAGLRLVPRWRASAGAYVLALQMSAQPNLRAWALAELAERCRVAKRDIHDYCNLVAPKWHEDANGVRDPVATLEALVSARNLESADQRQRAIRAVAERFATHAIADRAVLQMLSHSFRRQMASAVAAVRTVVGPIAEIHGELLRVGREWQERAEAGTRPDPTWCHGQLRRLEQHAEVLRAPERGGVLSLLDLLLNRLSVSRLLEVVADRMAGRVAAGNAHLSVEPCRQLLYVPGDPEPLEQVLSDLIANSLEAIFRRRLREPSIPGEVHVRARGDGVAMFVEVRDNGAGVTAQDIERLNRGAGLEHTSPGSGLGLRIAMETMRGYPGGQIRVSGNGDGPGTQVQLIFDTVPGGHSR